MKGYAQPPFLHFIFIGPNFLYWRYRTRNHRLQLEKGRKEKGGERGHVTDPTTQKSSQEKGNTWPYDIAEL
jgi:hypothetical protein